MRLIFTLIFSVAIHCAQAQVFMRPFDNAVAMGMSGATIAMPLLDAGVSNEGQLGLGNKLAFFAGSALPYSLSGWKSLQFQGMAGIGKWGGASLGIFHSATEYYTEQRFQLGYGRRLADKFYLGATADVLHNSAQEYGNNTFVTFSLSFLAQALPQVWLGAKIMNPLQQKLGADVAPTVLRIGATWKPGEQFLLSFETEKDLERPVQIKGGVEYRPVPLLAVRAGARGGKAAHIGFGTGLRLKNGLSLDLGAEWHPVLGMTPSAMISWRK